VSELCDVGTGNGPAFVPLTRRTLSYLVDDVEAFIAGRVIG
jgi:hypothetical protein